MHPAIPESDANCTRHDPSRRVFIKGTTAAASGFLFMSALAHRSTAEQPRAPETSPSPLLDDTIRTIHGLRSTHGNFSDDDLPEETLQTIIQASLRAANASNMQNYSIIVVRDRAVMKDVCGYRGSRLLVYCADQNRMMASAESLGYAYRPDNVTNFVTNTIDASVAAQTAVIAARSLGVDTLLTNGIHRGDMERHWKLLQLPATHCFPVIALVLGYPKQEPDHHKGRLDGTGIVHEGRYHRPTPDELAEITRRYDDPSTHLALNEDWASGNRKHYFDWLFKEWIATPSQPTQTPTPMLQILKRCNFIEA